MESWWTEPTVQVDRDAFREAQRAQEERWLKERQKIGQLMAGLATVEWMTGGGKRRGFAGNSHGVAW